jgi:MoaA/NifB/PqqE/SkfB family radical SAM enzyme
MLARKARDADRLLSLRLETSLSCNLHCKYCYRSSGKKTDNEMEYWELVNIIDQAYDLGAQSIVIIGGGEPTIYKKFKELVTHVDSLHMIPVVITNGQTMTQEISRFLNKHHASVMIKLDSLKEKVQDYLSGINGSYKRIQRGISNLIKNGFCTDNKIRLGASCVLNKLNAAEVFNIWRFCRNSNIFPNIETMTPNGRAKHHFNWILSGDEVQRIKYQLLALDQREYGYTWNPHTPLFGAGCRQLEYSLCITVEGFARPCAAILINHIDVKPSSPAGLKLAEALHDPLIKRARFAERYLTGTCATCEYKTNECIGCRGSAYVYGVLAGLDPFEAIVSQDPFCNKDRLLPEIEMPRSSICIG